MTQAVAKQQEAEKVRTDAMMAEIRDLKSQVASKGEPPQPSPSDPRDDILMKLMDKITDLESSIKSKGNPKGAEPDVETPGSDLEGEDGGEHIVTPDGHTVPYLNLCFFFMYITCDLSYSNNPNIISYKTQISSYIRKHII